MARLRTRKCVLGTVATKVDPDFWEFSTGAKTWRWTNALGANFYKVDDHGGMQILFHARKLDEAVMWAWGYTDGFLNGMRARQDVDRIVGKFETFHRENFTAGK
jgi:hypothetical protein